MKEVYYLDKVETELEVNEYLKEYAIGNNVKKELLMIKLGKRYCVIFLIPFWDIEEGQIEILRTSNQIEYGEINIDEISYKVETNKCYIIKYLQQKGYEELVENVLDNELWEIKKEKKKKK